MSRWGGVGKGDRGDEGWKMKEKSAADEGRKRIKGRRGGEGRVGVDTILDERVGEWK